MNLQPRQSFAWCRPLALPVLASLLLHGALLWPDPPRRPAEAAGRAPQVTVRLAVVSAPAGHEAPAEEAVMTVARAAGPAAVRPAEKAVPAGVDAAVPGASSTGATPAPAEGAPSEGALRALRYALARELAGGVWPELSGLPPAFTVAVHLRARRVIDVTFSGAGAAPATEAALRAAFKTAAQKAVIPDSLPADGFSVELELEAGDPERPNHDRPPLSG